MRGVPPSVRCCTPTHNNFNPCGSQESTTSDALRIPLRNTRLHPRRHMHHNLGHLLSFHAPLGSNPRACVSPRPALLERAHRALPAPFKLSDRTAPSWRLRTFLAALLVRAPRPSGAAQPLPSDPEHAGNLPPACLRTSPGSFSSTFRDLSQPVAAHLGRFLISRLRPGISHPPGAPNRWVRLSFAPPRPDLHRPGLQSMTLVDMLDRKMASFFCPSISNFLTSNSDDHVAHASIRAFLLHIRSFRSSTIAAPLSANPPKSSFQLPKPNPVPSAQLHVPSPRLRVGHDRSATSRQGKLFPCTPPPPWCVPPSRPLRRQVSSTLPSVS